MESRSDLQSRDSSADPEYVLEETHHLRKQKLIKLAEIKNEPLRLESIQVPKHGSHVKIEHILRLREFAFTANWDDTLELFRRVMRVKKICGDGQVSIERLLCVGEWAGAHPWEEEKQWQDSKSLDNRTAKMVKLTMDELVHFAFMMMRHGMDNLTLISQLSHVLHGIPPNKLT
jgi:hypothetical protein